MTAGTTRAVFTVKNENKETFNLIVRGRDNWALQQLIEAGKWGCTPLKKPAPRWSAYIYNLRNLGVDIETITERHGGTYAGNHARYVLRSNVTLATEGGAS